MASRAAYLEHLKQKNDNSNGGEGPQQQSAIPVAPSSISGTRVWKPPPQPQPLLNNNSKTSSHQQQQQSNQSTVQSSLASSTSVPAGNLLKQPTWRLPPPSNNGINTSTASALSPPPTTTTTSTSGSGWSPKFPPDNSVFQTPIQERKALFAKSFVPVAPETPFAVTPSPVSSAIHKNPPARPPPSFSFVASSFSTVSPPTKSVSAEQQQEQQQAPPWPSAIRSSTSARDKRFAFFQATSPTAALAKKIIETPTATDSAKISPFLASNNSKAAADRLQASDSTQTTQGSTTVVSCEESCSVEDETAQRNSDKGDESSPVPATPKKSLFESWQEQVNRNSSRALVPPLTPTKKTTTPLVLLVSSSSPFAEKTEGTPETPPVQTKKIESSLAPPTPAQASLLFFKNSLLSSQLPQSAVQALTPCSSNSKPEQQAPVTPTQPSLLLSRSNTLPSPRALEIQTDSQQQEAPDKKKDELPRHLKRLVELRKTEELEKSFHVHQQDEEYHDKIDTTTPPKQDPPVEILPLPSVGQEDENDDKGNESSPTNQLPEKQQQHLEDIPLRVIGASTVAAKWQQRIRQTQGKLRSNRSNSVTRAVPVPPHTIQSAVISNNNNKTKNIIGSKMMKPGIIGNSPFSPSTAATEQSDEISTASTVPRNNGRTAATISENGGDSVAATSTADSEPGTPMVTPPPSQKPWLHRQAPPPPPPLPANSSGTDSPMQRYRRFAARHQNTTSASSTENPPTSQRHGLRSPHQAASSSQSPLRCRLLTPTRPRASSALSPSLETGNNGQIVPFHPKEDEKKEEDEQQVAVVPVTQQSRAQEDEDVDFDDVFGTLALSIGAVIEGESGELIPDVDFDYLMAMIEDCERRWQDSARPSANPANAASLDYLTVAPRDETEQAKLIRLQQEEISQLRGQLINVTASANKSETSMIPAPEIPMVPAPPSPDKSQFPSASSVAVTSNTSASPQEVIDSIPFEHIEVAVVDDPDLCSVTSGLTNLNDLTRGNFETEAAATGASYFYGQTSEPFGHQPRSPEDKTTTRIVRRVPLELRAADGSSKMALYTGPVTPSGEYTGFGYFQFQGTGDVYKGEVRNGKMHGQGTYTYSRRSRKNKNNRPAKVLRGIFENNVFTGWNPAPAQFGTMPE